MMVIRERVRHIMIRQFGRGQGMAVPIPTRRQKLHTFQLMGKRYVLISHVGIEVYFIFQFQFTYV